MAYAYLFKYIIIGDTVLALVTWALRAAAAWPGLPRSTRARCSRACGSRLRLPEDVTAGRPSPGSPP
ncbi:hypothetical protein NN561_003627 [Cricetulus griseus]